MVIIGKTPHDTTQKPTSSLSCVCLQFIVCATHVYAQACCQQLCAR